MFMIHIVLCHDTQLWHSCYTMNVELRATNMKLRSARAAQTYNEPTSQGLRIGDAAETEAKEDVRHGEGVVEDSLRRGRASAAIDSAATAVEASSAG